MLPENARKPMIVQSDRTILLETDGSGFLPARDRLARFAELVKSPEYVHTYRITPLSIWNAASMGMTTEEMLAVLKEFSRYPVPGSLAQEIRELSGRFGRLRLCRDPSGLLLVADSSDLITELSGYPGVAEHVAGRPHPDRLRVREGARGEIKVALMRVGFPLDDRAGYQGGEPLPMRLRRTLNGGEPLALRPYQVRSVEALRAAGGSGVIVLPCGAGKTLVGMAVMAEIGQQALILVTGNAALRQWEYELLEKTSLRSDQVSVYTSEDRRIGPVTLATYQMLTYRSRRGEPFRHFALFDRPGWGLIVYDEVHLLPAPVFRATARVQAVRRLGLTATLVREDGREEDVFSLIGPKRFDMPWRDLEEQGWIARASCVEIRVPFERSTRRAYAHAELRHRFRIASCNPAKIPVLLEVLQRHPREPTLVIGQYLKQLEQLAEQLEVPLITGATPPEERQTLYRRFRAGEVRLLVVSKVANFAIDLPEASVAIQVSGTFGSRQEEAQRLGRILRPKSDGRPAHFYSLITRESREQDFALKRQLFLVEQGYTYRIEAI